MRRLTTIVALLAVPAGAAWAAMPAQTAPSTADRVAEACARIDPFVATTLLGTPADPSAPAIVAFQRSGGAPDGALVLATHGQVGDVYGLAFDPAAAVLYAAAYHRAGGAFGPGGPGAIYRIDVASGTVATLAQLAAGADAHASPEAAAMVGETSLGDIDIAADGSELYVANLFDGRIHRLALPGGRAIDTLQNGAAREKWRADARLFGLGVHDGWLYHGVVNSRVRTDDALAPFDAFVYRSRPGTAGTEYVLQADLQYTRTVPWAAAWSDTADGRTDDTPMLVDIAFQPGGEPVLGLRDRQADMVPSCAWNPAACRAGPSLGDLLPARSRGAGSWTVLTQPPWYRDTPADELDMTWGALAAVPRLDVMVSVGRADQVRPIGPAAGPAAGPDGSGALAGYWFDNRSGARVRSTSVYAPADGAPGLADVAPGDVEALCAPDARVDPAFGATLTAEAAAIATATASAEAVVRATRVVATRTAHVPTRVARETAVAETATALAPTLAAEVPTQTAAAATAAAVATAVVGPRVRMLEPTQAVVATMAARAPTPAPATATAYADAHAAIRQSCGGSNPYLATTSFAPMLDGAGQAYGPAWLAGQPAVVAFNDTAADDRLRHFNVAYQDQVGAVFGMAHDLARDHLYVAAYTKRLAGFGPLGPGGIYRVELGTGMVRPWAQLSAGRDPHDFRPSGSFDQAAAEDVGRVGLGDIEIATAADALYVVNLSDRLIYRLSVPEGRVVGLFPHGAAGQWWAADAQPFGLAYRDGWLYHAVVDTQARHPSRPGTAAHRPLAVYVYRSRPDGAEMAEVARVDLDYGRTPAWQPWLDADNDRLTQAQAMPVDIEFREDGDLVLGLRDRQADSAVLRAGYGDMVLTMRQVGDRFIPLTVPEFYHDNIIHAESSWGTLASMPWLDQVLSTMIDPITIYSGGIAWYDNISGDIVAKETIYAGASITFGKTAGLGDLEALCAPLTPTPTWTPTGTAESSATATPSPTATGTPTATVTPSPTASITPTPTPSLYTIYLPMIGNEPCVPEAIHTDVVLVIDMSTSMYRPTRSGRTKHAAALEAAKGFVSLLELEPDAAGGRDRVGIVGFNDRAWTAIGMSDDRAGVVGAIDGLLGQVQEGTRLDLAIDEGQAVLDRAPRVGGNGPVVILLTDGLPNRVPTPVGGGRQEDTVLAAAERAKRAGTRLFTIGLGERDDVLDTLMRAVASRPEDYFFAPDGEDLAAIYRQIAGRLTACP